MLAYVLFQQQNSILPTHASDSYHSQKVSRLYISRWLASQHTVTLAGWYHAYLYMRFCTQVHKLLYSTNKINIVTYLIYGQR